jgi:hypothetical protein
MRLVIRQEIREKATEDGLDEVRRINGGREVSPSTELFVKAAIEKAIDFLETKLA